MVNAFAIFANQGRALTPTLIDYIQDRHGQVIWRADTRPATAATRPTGTAGRCRGRRSRTRQVVDPMTAYQIVHILEGVVQRGTATILRDLGRPLFGKTGTTSGPTNVWFIGGSQQVVAGVYMGFDQPRPMGGYAQGGTLAAPIFRQFARTAFKDMPMFRSGRRRDPHGRDRPPSPASASSASGRPRSARGGDLGGVQARERAAAHHPPRATAARSAGRPAGRRRAPGRQAQQRAAHDRRPRPTAISCKDRAGSTSARLDST